MKYVNGKEAEIGDFVIMKRGDQYLAGKINHSAWGDRLVVAIPSSDMYDPSIQIPAEHDDVQVILAKDAWQGFQDYWNPGLESSET